MYPTDYLVSPELVKTWQQEFFNLERELRELADRIAEEEGFSRHTCPGPFTSLLLRAAGALCESQLAFRELEVREPLAVPDGRATTG